MKGLCNTCSHAWFMIGITKSHDGKHAEHYIYTLLILKAKFQNITLASYYYSLDDGSSN